MQNSALSKGEMPSDGRCRTLERLTERSHERRERLRAVGHAVTS